LCEEPSDLALHPWAFGLAVSMQGSDRRILWGRSAWAYTDDEIREFLRAPLWLDGIAARILCERKLTQDLGFSVGKPVNRENSRYSLESWQAQRAGVNGMPYWYPLRVPKRFQVWSEVRDYLNQPLGPCLVTGQSARGGAILVIPFGLADSGLAQLPMTDERRALYQTACRQWAGAAAPLVFVTAGPKVVPMEFRTPDRWVIAWNLLPDAQAAELEIGQAQAVREAWALAPLQSPQPLDCSGEKTARGLCVRSPHRLGYLELLAVRVE
jgi:hypothetical protein